MTDQLPGLAGLPPWPTRIGNDITMAIDSDPDLLTLPAARLRASDSQVCARRLGFRLFGTPPDLVDEWNPAARQRGQAIDRLVKDVIVRLHGGRADVHFSFLPDVPLDGIGDAIYPHPHGTELIAVEVKSTTTRKLMGVLGNWRSQPAGPEAAWVCQGALLALAEGCEWVHVIVVASDDTNNDRAPAEWLLRMDGDLVHLPVLGVEGGALAAETPRHLAETELARQAAVLRLVEAGTLPARDIPGYGRVEHTPPSKDQSGDPWVCRFCPWQPRCARLGPDEVQRRAS